MAAPGLPPGIISGILSTIQGLMLVTGDMEGGIKKGVAKKMKEELSDKLDLFSSHIKEMITYMTDKIRIAVINDLGDTVNRYRNLIDMERKDSDTNVDELKKQVIKLNQLLSENVVLSNELDSISESLYL